MKRIQKDPRNSINGSCKTNGSLEHQRLSAAAFTATGATPQRLLDRCNDIIFTRRTSNTASMTSSYPSTPAISRNGEMKLMERRAGTDDEDDEQDDDLNDDGDEDDEGDNDADGS